MNPYREHDHAQATTPPDVLICGFLADASIVRALGGRPVGVVTALTVQNTQGMRSCHEIDRDVFGAQLNALLTDIEVKAVKLGLLGSRAVIEELGEQLALTAAPVVWDPIGAPTQGDVRFGAELFATALKELGPHLALITPNTHELSQLVDARVDTLEQAIEGAQMFARIANVAVLVKGGHLGSDDATDVLCYQGGIEYFPGPRISQEDVHGTGCALSTAIATNLAHGLPLVEACKIAKNLVAERISHPVRPGRGAPAVV